MSHGEGFTVTRIDTPTSPDPPDAPFRPDDVFAAVGEAPYAWQLDSDALAWGPNAVDVLKLSDPQLIASGRAFAKLLDPDNVHTRFEAIVILGWQYRRNSSCSMARCKSPIKARRRVCSCSWPPAYMA